ncbi:phytoene desaturase [Phototrophicus methaneseepsis]|uniref:4,4'-diaponeurosporene oxygenase n=1 Tax=Phototrophicus methaneseepsis TaxID=2710758 RepID=A0A7S8E6R7_9CHLR|nr:phytoene desaturase family protein [Phototrophicus methaneseepsis]QPC81411.1 phytoene desaturase [Phototrophicus methaneseepsis]
MANLPIIIIGAGMGGLAAAIRLRLAGYDVHIYEKNATVGGKMSQFSADGFRWDTGPSVITMRHVFEELFQAANRNFSDYVTLQPLEPLTRYFYHDGTVLDAVSDLRRMAQQIERIEPRDVEGYLSYLAYAARIHRVTGPVFIYDQPPTLGSFARVPISEWLYADPFRTMQQAINSKVRSPYLRQLLGRFATYVGGSPYEAPATLNVIAHIELTGGVWYAVGGVYKIAEAVQRLALELGVEIYTNTVVDRILVESGTAMGVTLANGETATAKAVLANVDVTTTYDQLLKPDDAPKRRLKQLKAYEPSCSGFVMMLGIDKQHPQLAHHNIFFSDDYPAEFQAIFKKQQPAENPTIYVAITSKTDADHAPPNYENWFVLVNAPALSQEINWRAIQSDYRNRILGILAGRGFDIRENIISEHILTPLDLQVMSGAWRGALYGPSANKTFTAFLRPHNRSRDIQRLYFVGGTTHPGGGIPMVTLSGKTVAQMIIDDIV